MDVPPGSAHPRELVSAAVARYGVGEVVAWCCRLMSGVDLDDDPDVAWLGGSEDWHPYWRRVWGARGLLYVWGEDGDPVGALRVAASDEHWRVREMACKVVRARLLEELESEMAELAHDPNQRVRAAATRALAALQG